jgi:hypothetical protein
MRSLAGPLALLAATCHRGAGAPAASSSTSSVAVGAHPAELAIGDVDGDGAPDLVTVDRDGARVDIRLQRAGAWVAPPTGALVPGEPVHLVALADLDGDRRPELIATGHDSAAVRVWTGDRGGGFAGPPRAFTAFATLAACHPHNHGLAVGDLDGDGALDVVAADQEQAAVAILLGDGGGGLGPATGSPFALGGQTYPPALGDVDGDGALDVVAPLVGASSIAVLLGDGRGGLAPAPGSPHRTGRARPYGIALGDLDGDRRVDVVATHDDTDRVSVLLGAGGGRLRAAPGSPIALGRRIGRPLLTDVDGDGHLDVVGAGSGALVIARGLGGGRFAAARAERLGEGWRVAAADVDGDGRVELAAPATDDGVVRLWPGRARR